MLGCVFYMWFVLLFGYCFDGDDEKFLVYKYIFNGDLVFVLYMKGSFGFCEDVL